MASTSDPHSVDATAPWQLSLLGFWQLRRKQQPVDVGGNVRRLLALLALKGSRDRSYIAGLLWPEHTESHAHGNLRATLSRLHQRRVDVLDISGQALSLPASVAVDVHDFLATADTVLTF